MENENEKKWIKPEIKIIASAEACENVLKDQSGQPPWLQD